MNSEFSDRRYWAGKIWPRCSSGVEMLQWNARYRAWLKEHSLTLEGSCESRERLYELVCPKEKITYLEFGVFEGESLRLWTSLNKDPASAFHGFDSFEGLPENGAPWNKGQFALDAIPTFDDSRIKIHPGWFNETLLPFLEEPLSDARLVIHIDADLYSSTLYVLATLAPLMGPGTILIFDELCVAHQEFRALVDWLAAFKRPYTIIAGFKRNGRVEGVALRLI